MERTIRINSFFILKNSNQYNNYNFIQRTIPNKVPEEIDGVLLCK